MIFFFRHFKLHLTPNKDIFDENFRAYSVGPNDVKTEVPINKESFYRGYDEGIVGLPMIVIVMLYTTELTKVFINNLLICICFCKFITNT